jgi:hypothetical protein
MAGKFTKPAVDMQSVPVPVRQVPAPKKDTMKDTEASLVLTLEEFTGLKQARIHELNKKQIVHVRSLIQLASPDDPQLPDYYFRLAELFTENFQYWNNLARSLDEPIFRAQHATSPSAQ